jgi:hypothetical protein
MNLEDRTENIVIDHRNPYEQKGRVDRWRSVTVIGILCLQQVPEYYNLYSERASGLWTVEV